jgi:hypothetical protein
MNFSLSDRLTYLSRQQPPRCLVCERPMMIATAGPPATWICGCGVRREWEPPVADAPVPEPPEDERVVDAWREPEQ